VLGGGVRRELERLDAVRLQGVRAPEAMHGAVGQPTVAGGGPGGPVGAARPPRVGAHTHTPAAAAGGAVIVGGPPGRARSCSPAPPSSANRRRRRLIWTTV